MRDARQRSRGHASLYRQGAGVEDSRLLSTAARARWAVGVATLFGLGAMVRYPGGDPLDHARPGYAITRNFLSDLGMTVAYNGELNRVGASLFVASLLVLIAGIGTILVTLVGRYSNTRRSRIFAQCASVAGALAGAAFVAVAFTPENRFMSLHVQSTVLGWRLVPVASAFLLLAAMFAKGIARGGPITLAALTLVLTAYVALLEWGPSTASLPGLQADVIAQKIASAVLVGAVLLLSGPHERTSTDAT